MESLFLIFITYARFPLPELTARELRCIFDTRQLGRQKMHPSWRAINSAREFGPWTRVVETGLYANGGNVFTLLVGLFDHQFIHDQKFVDWFSGNLVGRLGTS